GSRATSLARRRSGARSRPCSSAASPPARPSSSRVSSRSAGELVAAREEELRHALLRLALVDVAEAPDEVEHAAIFRQDVGTEPPHPARGRGIEHLADEDRAEPSALPAVLDDERDLDRVRLVGRLVASDRDDLDPAGAAAL